MEMTTFKSSALGKGSYNLVNAELTLDVLGKIRKDGTRKSTTYIYLDVPVEIWVGLCEADSSGKFWIENIIGKFTFIVD